MNWLQNIHFEIQVDRLPQTVFRATKVGIPSVTMTPALQANPMRSPIPHAPDSLEFGNLSLTCIADENLKSWEEMYSWALMGFPETFDQFEGSKYEGSHHSDISVILFSNKINPILSFDFRNAIPVNVPEFMLDTTQTERSVVEFVIDFAFDSFDIKRIK